MWRRYLSFYNISGIIWKKCAPNWLHLKKWSGKCKFQGNIYQLVSMHLIWNFEGSLVEHQSCYKQNFKFLTVQEPNFLEPKFRQNRPLTGFCMYIGPASVFFLYLDLSSVLCKAVFPMYLVSPIGLPAY